MEDKMESLLIPQTACNVPLLMSFVESPLEKADTTNPDLTKLFKLNVNFAASTYDNQLVNVLDFFL